MEEKDLQKKLDELKDQLEKAATDKAKADIKAQMDAFEAKHKDALESYAQLKKDYDDLKAEFDKVSKNIEANQPVIDAFVNDKKNGKIITKERTFNQNLHEVIMENEASIKSFKKGSAPVSMDLKTVGDMSISANFPDAGLFTQDIRQTIVATPYNRVWLADILPQGTSSQSNSILYPKENGGEGGAAAWTDPTADKAQMDFDLTTLSAYFKWIAGYLIVPREMLDDIAFLSSYLQQKMLISLKIAENDFVINGTSDTNPVDGLTDVAQAYDGSFTNPVDVIVDAGWGQIVTATNNFYNPTNVILYPRDAVAIGLNKAEGSGEYNLPAGSVAFANGQLTVGGMNVVSTTQLGAGNFLVFDRNATMFVRRMQPELRLFEDATLAKKNKVMFRVEERATLIIFNDDAIVSGTISFS